MLRGTDDPSGYTRKSSRERFAVAKFYGMGSDGEWSAPEIADALDVSTRTVHRYLNQSDIAQEVQDVLAATEAEWRLDMALDLRKEIRYLNEVEQELKQRKKAVATDFSTKTVHGTPTGDRNVSLADDAQEYRLKMPVPVDFETVTDYSADLQEVQAEKRRYWDQIADLLGLDDTDSQTVDETLADSVDEVKIVEVRQTDDAYPEQDVVDMAEVQDVEDVPEEDQADG